MGKLKLGPCCPECNAKLDGFTSATEEGVNPTPGDLTFCLYCATFLKFTTDMDLQKVGTVEVCRHVPPEVFAKAMLAHTMFMEDKRNQFK